MPEGENGAATFCSVMFTRNINDIPSKIFMTYLTVINMAGLTKEEALTEEWKKVPQRLNENMMKTSEKQQLTTYCD